MDRRLVYFSDVNDSIKSNSLVMQLIRVVESDGWRHVRTTGSHRHYKHRLKPNVVTIPGHSGDDVPTGTLKSILKAAGLQSNQ